MEENLGAFEEKRNEAAETAESAGKGGKRLAKGGKRGWAIAGIALGVLAAAYLGLCAYATLSGTIYPNTTVGGVDYGGMTEEQAAGGGLMSIVDDGCAERAARLCRDGGRQLRGDRGCGAGRYSGGHRLPEGRGYAGAGAQREGRRLFQERRGLPFLAFYRA